VFNDPNADGIKKGKESGLAGWNVFMDSNANGLLDAGERTATVDSTGAYSFGPLKPRTYRVTVQRPGDSTLIPTGLPYSIVKIGSGAAATVDSGFAQPVTVSGTAFNDKNLDTVRQHTEPVLAGVTVYVDQNNNWTQDPTDPSAVSDERGKFTLTAAGTGERVMLAAPIGTLRMGDDTLFDLSQSSNVPVPLNDLGGIFVRVFSDKNENGLRDSGEKYSISYQSDLGIWLDQDLDGYLGYDEMTYDSYMGFTDLAAGTYYVSAVGLGFPYESLDITTPADGVITVKLKAHEVRIVDIGVYYL
jgi:hypothetical protein